MISNLPGSTDQEPLQNLGTEEDDLPGGSNAEAPATHLSGPNPSVSQATSGLASSHEENSDLSSVLADYAAYVPWLAEQNNQAPEEPGNQSRRQYTDAEKNKAARVITRAFREKIANDTTKEMVTRGERWKQQLPLASLNKLPGENTFRSLQSHSAQHLQNLHAELSPFTPEEKGFLDRGLSMKYYATHFTRNDLVSTNAKGQQVATLFSRDKLLRDGTISFRTGNSKVVDRYYLGNSDHVFFALEVGDTPKKQKSQFGPNRLRVPLDHPSFRQTASLKLNDSSLPQLRDSVLAKYGASSEEAQTILGKHYHITENFVGKDMVPGLLMTAISDSRKIGHDTNQKIMNAQTEDDFNEIFSGLYRPEVRVPRHFFVENPIFAKIEINADPASLSVETEINADPTSEGNASPTASIDSFGTAKTLVSN
jgi:hypothetical protein